MIGSACAISSCVFGPGISEQFSSLDEAHIFLQLLCWPSLTPIRIALCTESYIEGQVFEFHFNEKMFLRTGHIF